MRTVSTLPFNRTGQAFDRWQRPHIAWNNGFGIRYFVKVRAAFDETSEIHVDSARRDVTVFGGHFFERAQASLDASSLRRELPNRVRHFLARFKARHAHHDAPSRTDVIAVIAIATPIQYALVGDWRLRIGDFSRLTEQKSVATNV